jgi:peptide/nickel transport system permease protein
MLASSIAGAFIGTASAYFGGKTDIVVQRFIDATAAFPTLLLALALTAAFGSSLNNIIFALVIVFTPRVARVVRSVSLSIKETPYVEAGRAIGASDLRIMLRHVLPNTFASLIVVSTSLIGSAVLIEASLSFLGVSGLPASVISWGSMLGGDVLIDFPNAPWVGIAPATALTVAVFGVNVLGDALRDVLDPRLRGTQGAGAGT